MDDALASITFPAQHRAKLRSTPHLERLEREVKRRADVVGVLPNETSIRRLIGTVLLEQNDDWICINRYMQVEVMVDIDAPANQTPQITAEAT